MTLTMLLRLAAWPGLAGLALSAQACETLQAEIDAKIRATGASNFTLVTVDADAPVGGRVVGTCGLGRKKIVYTPAAGAPSAGAGSGLRTTGTLNAPVVRAAPPPAPAAPPVLTECKPGFTGPDCRRRIAPPAVAPAPAAPVAAEPRKPASAP
jgi:hypothetical protein